VTAFIDTHRDRFGVVPICRVLTEHGCPIAPSTYYAGRKRLPCARQVRDELVLDEVCRVHKASRGGLYGARKIYHQLSREGVTVEGSPVARCTIERLMRTAGMQGVRRDRQVRTTIADEAAARPADLVKRDFTATRPNELWVVDFTYVATLAGFVYVAFAIDGCTPRSEWCTRALMSWPPWARVHRPMFRASRARSVRSEVETCQPTMRRLKTSRTNAQ